MATVASTPISATIEVILQDAMFAAKVLGQDQVPQAGDLQLSLRILRRMLDTWANDTLMVYATNTDTFTMVPGTASYLTSLLPQRPVSIAAIRVRLSDIDNPVTFIDLDAWNAIPYKQASSIPTNCYYEPSFPDGLMNFYPTPQAAYTCYVDSRVTYSDLDLNTVLQMPPGYEDAIVNNLAVLLYPYFRNGDVPAHLQRAAVESKAALKRTNYQPLEMNVGIVHQADISNSFPYRTF